MNKFKVLQNVYLPNKHMGIIIKVLDNDCYLVRENSTEREYTLREDMISESESGCNCQFSEIQLTLSKLSKMKKLKSYREKYDIYQSNDDIVFSHPIYFSNRTSVTINWNSLISKFEIMAIDHSFIKPFTFIIPNLGFDIYGSKYICDTEEEIINILEVIRTQIEIKKLKSGDVFVCHDGEDDNALKPYMIVDLDYAICLLDGSCFDISSMVNSKTPSYVSKIDNPFLNKTNQIY